MKPRLARRKITKALEGTELPDATVVVIKPEIPKRKLTELEKLQIVSEKEPELTYIRDADKAKYYENMQNFYNNNFFGYDIFGNPTNYTDPADYGKIQENFDYSKSNAYNFLYDLAAGALGYTARGIFPKRIMGKSIKGWLPFKINEGAEAQVFRNNPRTVGKVNTGGKHLILLKNKIPNAAQNELLGYVKADGKRSPVMLQRKLRITTDENFPKYINKLDKSMAKKGYTVVNDPNVQYRAYTNGRYVVDDVSPDNVGVTIFGRPKMIDFNVQPVLEWLDLGYTLGE